MDYSEVEKNLIEGLYAPFSSWKRFSATALASFLAFSASVLSTNIGYSVQMLSSGPRYWPVAFNTRLFEVVMSSGLPGVFLTAVFSVLVGITMTNTFIQLKMNRISKDALGALPGFLAGGCASCGVGVLSILGLGGVLTFLPFGGNLLKLGGVLLLLGLITRTGNPETCKL